LAPPCSAQSALGDVAEVNDAVGFGADLGEERVTVALHPNVAICDTIGDAPDAAMPTPAFVC
jgi:hypothetical protein